MGLLFLWVSAGDVSQLCWQGEVNVREEFQGFSGAVLREPTAQANGREHIWSLIANLRRKSIERGHYWLKNQPKACCLL